MIDELNEMEDEEAHLLAKPLTSDENNKGMLDPYVIMQNFGDGYCLTGVNIRMENVSLST